MLLNAITELIVKRTGCDADAVTLESRFEDFGIDSLDTMEVLIQLESEIGREIELSERLDTVADLINVIEDQVGTYPAADQYFYKDSSPILMRL
jgi:acyl carrier protein